MLAEDEASLRDWPFIAARSPRIVDGDGAYLITDEGRRILDAAGGAIVTNIGHGRAEVAEAIARASAGPTFVVPTWRTPQREALAERLRRDWLPEGLHHIHLTSGGSEGVEAAVKIALQHFAGLGQTERLKIMSREVSYHGTTIAMAGLSGHQSRKRGLDGYLTTHPKALDAPQPTRCAARWASNHLDAGYAYYRRGDAGLAMGAAGPETIAATSWSSR